MADEPIHHRHYLVRCTLGPYWFGGDQMLPCLNELPVGTEVTWSTTPGWIMKRENDLPFVGEVLCEAAIPMERHAHPKVAGLVRPVHPINPGAFEMRKVLEAFREVSRLPVDPVELEKLHTDIGAALGPNVDPFTVADLLLRIEALRA